MFISSHHCGELVGEPMTIDGNVWSGIVEFETSWLSIAEKPARTSLTMRSLTTHVSPTERSVFFDGRLYPFDTAIRPSTFTLSCSQLYFDTRANARWLVESDVSTRPVV